MQPQKKLIVVGLLVNIAAALPSLDAAAADQPDLEHGEKIFAQCKACHDAPAEAPNRGPTLRGVLGRRAGSVRGFLYSRALKNAKLVWDEASLDALIANPQRFLPGTTMPFPGLPDEIDRRDLIAFLKTLP
jgi:cytochrome c